MKYELKGATTGQLELEIQVAASPEALWTALFADIDRWWLPDFRTLGEKSKLSFDPQPGGRGLLESSPAAGDLQWYQVQMYQPSAKQVYLVGHIAPDWGGPTTSMLKLSVCENDGGCVLKIVDARLGKVSESDLETCRQGWQQLFGEGLKPLVEQTS